MPPVYPDPFAIATANSAGLLSANDFVKLSTIPVGASVAVMPYSAVIDLTTTGTYVIMPAMTGRLRMMIASAWLIESTGGTLSGGAVFSIGTNTPNFDNLYASQGTPAALLTQVANTYVVAGTSISPLPAPSTTADGIKIKVTTAVTGTLPVLTVRLLVQAGIMP